MEGGPSGASRTPAALRRYPPLVLMTSMLAILALVLPSALRIPDQDPTPVLEFAPIPPQDEEPPADPGNLSTLALGSSDTLAEPFDVAPEVPGGEGDRPPGKSCYRDPVTGELRQTADPMAPPCVPYWDSGNFGETWQGVTEDEIRVLLYLDVGCPNHECSPNAGTYLDLDDPPKPQCPKTWPGNNPNRDRCDYIWIRVARGMMHYFNDAFQTYGRTVRYYAYISDATSEAARRADAAANFDDIRPFAVIDYATYFGHNEAYAGSMAARGVTVFSSRTALPNAYFLRYPSFAWGFWPDVERWSDLYSSYVCTKVHGHPVVRMGDPPGSAPQVGGERVYGFWSTSDPSEPGLQLFAQLVERKLRDRSGLRPAEKRTFRSSGFGIQRSDSGADARDAVVAFRAADVTTVLYLGGMEGQFSRQSAALGYFPEIVVAGDLENDNNEAGRIQEQRVWRNAWGTHLQLRMDGEHAAMGAQAYRAGNPSGAAEDSRFANEMYRDHFMLFQAIQVAGPNLTPQKIDEGFHAIPPKRSDSPYVASCYFERNDYTCVKDAAEVWWDPSAPSRGDGQPGCWRMVNGGMRSRATDWSGGNEVFRSQQDPCTAYDSRFQINPG